MEDKTKKFENYKKFLDVVGRDLNRIFEFQKEYIHCKQGCSYCCRKGDYPISRIEYEYLMEGFEKLDYNLKEQIKANIKKTKQDNQESYICPFLIDDSCSLYNYRPLVCRTFGVLTEDSSGNPSFPFCATKGLNFSEIYDKEKNHLSVELVEKNHFKVFPRIFRLNNKVIMNIPLAKELNIDFGEAKKMIDFL